MLSPAIAPAEAQRITSQSWRSPVPASTPAVITTVSAGTSGKNASIAETAKIARYDQSLETHSSNWSNTASSCGRKARTTTGASSQRPPTGPPGAAMMRAVHRPLEGIRVLDVTTSIAGPYCAQILAALGADVVKVERPDTGDDGRAWGPPFWDGEGTMFLSANAGKRSLALSLRDRRGRDALLRLVDGADVFLQSLRPGLADELGIGPETLRTRNPRLVYCSIGAYGRVGPLSREPGYDALMQAAGGLISITGESGRPGVRLGSSLIDQGTGTWAALGVLAALLERERTGEGVEVDVSLYETALGYLGYHLAGYLADGAVPRGEGTRFPMVAPYEVFPTADGELMIAGGNDRLFRSICEVVGLPELVDDSRFRTNPDRVRNRDALASLLVARLATATTAAWHRKL